VKPQLARLRASKPWRAWKRYAEARGNILAAGVGYFAFFSIFPATALAFSVFGFVLRGHPELLASIAESLSANLPGFVKDAQNPDGLIPIQAPQAAALTVTGVIAFVTLVLAGMGWLGAVREGIRAVFGVPGPVGNLVTTKLRDLGVLFTLGLGVAASAVLTSVVGVAAGWVADLIGISGRDWALVSTGLAVSVLADTGLMMVLLRILSGVPVSWRNVFQGALVGGVGFSLLKLSATTLLPRLTANPLFASIAIVIGLLVWLNLIARLTLIAAAWAANDVDATHLGDLHGDQAPGPIRARAGASETAEAVDPPRRAVVRAGSMPTFGARSGDRMTLGAGVVLGAAAMAAMGALVRAIRSVAGPWRG
jgi:membrane protein